MFDDYVCACVLAGGCAGRETLRGAPGPYGAWVVVGVAMSGTDLDHGLRGMLTGAVRAGDWPQSAKAFRVDPVDRHGVGAAVVACNECGGHLAC